MAYAPAAMVDEDKMTVRPPTFPGKGTRWRMSAHEVAENDQFIEQCLKLWDRGYDTAEIAKLMFQPEHIVETAARIGRERRRG